MTVRVSRRSLRALLLTPSALLPLCGLEAAAQETLTLPQINVTAPSPIVRRRPPAPPSTTAAPVAAPAAPAEIPLQGALPIVTDQFATVTVVPSEEIQRSAGSTLGDVLFSQARHHRLELCARRIEPADHPRPRRQPRRHRRERRRRRRRVRPRRRPFRAGRSAGHATRSR